MQTLRDVIKNMQYVMVDHETKPYEELVKIGENLMLNMLVFTNLQDLKNPMKSYRKILSKVASKKNTDQVLKYCRLVGLKVL